MNNRTAKIGTKTTYWLGRPLPYPQSLKPVYKVFYIAGVFIGLNLFWYGVWTAIGDTSILNIPLVAIISNVVLLLITGKIKALL